MATGVPKKNGNDVPNGCGLDLELKYGGKKSEADILKTHTAQLELVWGHPNERNKLFFGENLSVLASLMKDENVRGKVRLIYIDPPFATRMTYQSRNLSHAYVDLLWGSHYVEFLRERLIFLRELLADDGSIYVHLDENMAFHIKVIMDEVFGPKNYRNWITRKKCNPKNYTRNTYGNVSDFILFYTKSDSYVWNRPLEAWTPERAAKEYEYIEEETGRPYKKVPIHAPGTRNGETGKLWRGMMPPPGKHWQFTPATLDEMDARGEIYWSSNGNPRRKVYFDASSGVGIQDIWLDFRDAHNQNIHITGYPTEKNAGLLARIIQASSNKGDLVLDCFSGSGTTLSAASNLGRNWIGIDNSEEALRTTLVRFHHGTRPMGDFVKDRLRRESLKHQPDLPLELVATSKGKSSSPLKIKEFALYSVRSHSAQVQSAITRVTESDTESTGKASDSAEQGGA